jgi:hypothetical protein
MQEPNYRELIKKYSQHVGQIEGVSYLEDGYRRDTDVFTDEEWAIMRELNEEGIQDHRNKHQSSLSGSVDVMEGWNDGESDAEYCANRFGENFEYLR